MSLSTDVKEIRTRQINDFMSQFLNLNDVDTSIIEEGLKNILGETPGIDFEYDIETPLNETTGVVERKKKLAKIHIYYSFTDENNLMRASKVSYLVD